MLPSSAGSSLTESPQTMIARAAERFKADGIKGVTVAAFLRVPVVATLLRWWLGDHPWLGRRVEKHGNRVTLEGCSFSLDADGISPAIKSRFALGRYERPERSIVKRFLAPELPLIELGGGLGVVACIANRMLLDPSRHVVVEANPRLIPLLRTNRDHNGCRFDVVHAALAYGQANCTLFLNSDFLSSGLTPQRSESVVVPAVSLGEILKKYRIDRCTLITDIEGVEIDLVANEGAILAAHAHRLILELHPVVVGQERVRQMLRTLETLGFEREHRRSEVYVFRNRAQPRHRLGPSPC